MKIAIHHNKNSFSDRWIEYCIKNKIEYKIVNCFDVDIISQLEGFNGLMWHWSHTDPKSQLMAKQLTLALEKGGIKVFPNTNTVWHFDDKIAQSFLFKSLNIPHIKTYISFDKNEALKWSKTASFPKVFKLRGGAGSANVKLVKTITDANKLINKAFGKGFGLSGRTQLLKNRIWVFKRDKNIKSIIGVFKGILRYFVPTDLENILGKEKGYVYFQEFIPNNDFDTRVIVVGNKIFAVRRYNRKDDFRASGSGIKGYDKELFDSKSLQLAFDLSKKLSTQSLACDFIYDKDDVKLIEISYGFVTGPFYDDCPGYWDEKLKWHETKFKAQYFMIEDFIKSI